MIEEEFSVGTVNRVNFGVCLRPDSQYRFVPSETGVQRSLTQVLADTLDELNALEGEWEQYDVSEDYGAARKVMLPRDNELAARLSDLYDMDALEDVGNIMQHVGQVEFYFAQFWDADGRKAIGVARSGQFKAMLGASRRMVVWGDDTLKLIEGNVFRLERYFDAVITAEGVYMARPKPVEYVAEIVSRVAGAAAEKVQAIEDALTYLDLSLIKRDIGKHPQLARLATAIAARPDLHQIRQDRLIQVTEQHGILMRPVDGKLRPLRRNEGALLEVLDDRRYATQLTEADPVPFRATGRQKVVR